MKVKFLADRRTLKYGEVKKGQTVKCSKEDGEAFIANGVAVSAGGAIKEVRADG